MPDPMSPADWPTPALTLLDVLWGLDTHVAVIRKKMHERFGFYPSPDEVRIAANRHKERAHRADPALDAPRDARTIVAVPFVEARRPDRVRLVAPGTHAVRGFSMLRGRLHG